MSTTTRYLRWRSPKTRSIPRSGDPRFISSKLYKYSPTTPLPPSPSPSSRSHSSAEVEEQLLSPQAPHDSSDTEGREESASPGNPPQRPESLATQDNDHTEAQDLVDEAEVATQLLVEELDATDIQLTHVDEHLAAQRMDSSAEIENIKAMMEALRIAVMTKSRFLKEKKEKGFRNYTVETVSLSRIKQHHIESMGLPNSQRHSASEQIFKERVLFELLEPAGEMNLTLIREWEGIDQFSDTLDLIKTHLGGLTEARSRFAVDQFVLALIRLFRTPTGLRDIIVFTEPILATQKHPVIFDVPTKKYAIIVTGRGDYLISSYMTDPNRIFPFEAFKVIVRFTDIKTQLEDRRRMAVMMIETKNLTLKDLLPYLNQVIGEALVIMVQQNEDEATGSGLYESKKEEATTPDPVSFCLTNSEIWIFGVVACGEDGVYSCRYTDPIMEDSKWLNLTDLFHAFALWATIPGSVLNDAMVNGIHLGRA